MGKSMFGTVNEFEWDGVHYVAVEEESCCGCDFTDQCSQMRHIRVGCTENNRPDGRSVIWKKAQPNKPKSGKAIRTIESYISCLEQGNEPDLTLDEVVNALKKVIQLAKTNFTPQPTRIN